MNAGKVFAILFGIFFLILGFSLFIGGVGVFAVTSIFSDDEGYLTTPEYQLSVPDNAVALVFTDIDINAKKFGPNVGFIDYGKFVTIKISISGDDNYFIGVASSSDIEAYLANSTYAEIDDIDYNSGLEINSVLKNEDKLGDLSNSPTTNVEWAAEGNENSPLKWAPKAGSWALIIMKADGTANVDASISAGARVPLLNVVAGFLVVFGLVFFVLAMVLFIIAVRTTDRKVVSMPYQPTTPEQQTTDSAYGTPAPKISSKSFQDQSTEYPESTDEESVFVVAEYGPRILAFIIDALVVSFIVGMFQWPFLFLNPESGFFSDSSSRFFLFPVTFSLNTIGLFIYFFVMEGYYGTTLGKEIMKLQVITESGENPELKDIAISAVGKAFFLPIDFIVGAIMGSKKPGKVQLNQRLMQTVSKTIVIVKPPQESETLARFVKKRN